MTTKPAAAAIALAFLVSGCGGTPSTPTAPNATGGSPTTSASLFNGFAATLTGGSVFGAIAATPGGENFGVMTQTGASGQIVKVTGATFVAPDGTSAVVYAGNDGLPARAVFGAFVVLFSSYTSNTVDVAVVAADGTVTNARGVPVDANMLADLKSLPAELSASATSSTRTLALTPADLRGFALGLKIGGLMLSTASCAGSITLLGTPAAPATVLIAAPCISFFVKALTIINPSLDSPGLGASSSLLLSLTTCLGTNSPEGCTAVIATALSKATSAAEAILFSQYDGRWFGAASGISSVSSPARVEISFDVSGNRVTNFSFPWRIDTRPGTTQFPYCGGNGRGGDVTIRDGLFLMTGSDQFYSVRISGAFSGSNTVTGVAQFTRQSAAEPWCASATIAWSGTKR